MHGVLRAHYRTDLGEIMAAAPMRLTGEAVRRALRSDGDGIFVGERRFSLKSSGRIFIVGAGKAGAPMTEAAVGILGERVSAGAVVVKEGHLGAADARIGNVEMFEWAPLRTRRRRDWRNVWQPCGGSVGGRSTPGHLGRRLRTAHPPRAGPLARRRAAGHHYSARLRRDN